MKKNFKVLLIIFIPLFVVLYLFYVNRVIITIRLNELRNYLQETDKSEGGIDHISLIATYEIHKKIYESRMSRDEADSAEFRLNSLSLTPQSSETLTGGFNRLIMIPALYLINFNRLMLDKPPVNLQITDDHSFRELDKAYYYERNLMFRLAIPLYDEALKNNIFSARDESSILLRQGYCNAMAGYNDSAMTNYRKIIKDFSQESSAITASILIRYLEGFTSARDNVLLNESDPVLKSRKLVDLLAYEQALKIIEDIEHKAAPGDIPSLQYFKARCYSGLGEPAKAVENYITLITGFPSSPYAKYANRKLYMIGKSAASGNEILDISRRLNRKLNDPVLTEFIKTDKDSVSAGIIYSEPVIIKVPEKLAGMIAEMTSEVKTSADIFLVIVTNDGNTFKGRLIQKNNDAISIETSIGRIDVKRNKILKVSATN